MRKDQLLFLQELIIASIKIAKIKKICFIKV